MQLDPTRCVVFFGAENPESNWHPAPFIDQGNHYLTNEHWIMVKKAALFGDFATANKILRARRPKDAKALGRQVQGFDLELWGKWRSKIMAMGKLKQAQAHPAIYARFLANAGKTHIEASPYDLIWGVGYNASDPNVYLPNQWLGINLAGKAMDHVCSYIARIHQGGT